MLELIFGTKTKIKVLQILTMFNSLMTRNELANKTHSGIRSIYEQIDELIAIGVLKEIKVNNGRSKVILNQDFPFYDNIRELFLLSKDLFRLPKDILTIIDRICEDKYYLGAFTAARQKIIPIDYDPPIYVINILKGYYKKFYQRIRALNKLENIKVYEINEILNKAGEITIIVNPCDNIPPDIVRTDFSEVEIWIASIERGLIECLTKRTPFTMYGTYLVFLQNKLDNVLDIAYLKKLAYEENCIQQVLTIMSKFNEIIGKEVFEITQEEKGMAQASIDEKEIKHAVNTVIG